MCRLQKFGRDINSKQKPSLGSWSASKPHLGWIPAIKVEWVAAKEHYVQHDTCWIRAKLTIDIDVAKSGGGEWTIPSEIGLKCPLPQLHMSAFFPLYDLPLQQP